jgi:hypothetical protein
MEVQIQPESKPQWPFVPVPMNESHLDLVYGTWLRNMYENCSHFRQVRHGNYRKGQARIIDHLLRGANVLMASAPGGGSDMGWVCYEQKGGDFILHYIYVRSTFRRNGIATALLRHAGCDVGAQPITCTHWTDIMPRYRQKWQLNYNPYIAWRIL